jgi:uncharacterized Tic20 family protein
MLLDRRYQTTRDKRQARDLARQGLVVVAKGSERALAAIAHGAIAFGFLGIGFLVSLAITGVIWLTSLKSSYVREQSDRAGRYQIFVLLVNILSIVLWLIGLVLLLYLTNWRGWGNGGWQGWTHLDWRWLAVVLDGLALIIAVPLFIAWYIGTIAYGVYGAIRALGGHDFHYPPPPWARRPRHPRDQPLRWVD